jgi:hypothetical protein
VSESVPVSVLSARCNVDTDADADRAACHHVILPVVVDDDDAVIFFATQTAPICHQYQYASGEEFTVSCYCNVNFLSVMFLSVAS